MNLEPIPQESIWELMFLVQSPYNHISIFRIQCIVASICTQAHIDMRGVQIPTHI